ncbi:hypothetical protein I4U23_012330 [Adineta vaga]|nr:hypothetical protein I4U23_012330 [Adineta vaga]
MYWGFVNQALFRLCRIVHANARWLRNLWLYILLPPIELVLVGIVFIPLIFWRDIVYLSSEHYCYVSYKNIRGILWVILNAYGSPVLLLSMIYLRIAIYIHRQSNNLTMVVKLRQERDLRIVRRIVVIVCLLLLLGMPAVVIVMLFVITGQEQPLFFRVEWFSEPTTMAQLGRLVFLLNSETGSRHRLDGFKPSETLSDLPKFAMVRKYATDKLPPSVDLRQLMTPVEDQEQIGSCVGNALAAAYEFLIMKNTGKHVDVSRLFIYFNGRIKDGAQESNMKDSGTFIKSAIAGLTEFGCCKEKLHPYETSSVNRKPLSNCYAEAKKYCITNGMQLKTELDEMKACLAQGYPFTFGLQLFKSFSQAETNGGRVPMPDVGTEAQRQEHGWHAMLAVGYSDRSQCFIVRNSWGEKWGDKGYCYIPYSYMCNPTHCKDLHAIKTISDDRDHESKEVMDNSYDWETHKNSPFFIPSNYSSNYFKDRWFWKPADLHDYSESGLRKGLKHFFEPFAESRRNGSGCIQTV